MCQLIYIRYLSFLEFCLNYDRCSYSTKESLFSLENKFLKKKKVQVNSIFLLEMLWTMGIEMEALIKDTPEFRRKDTNHPQRTYQSNRAASLMWVSHWLIIIFPTYFSTFNIVPYTVFLYIWSVCNCSL